MNNDIYPLGKMKQYPIERELFCKIFKKVYMLWYELDPFRYIMTDDFILFYDSNNETAYMIHKDSGIVISWYKFYHLGRCLECNKVLSVNEYKLFAKLLENDLKEIKI